MSLTQKAVAALASVIFLCCLFAFLLVGSGAHFQQANVIQELEHQDTQELLRGDWHVFYHDEWDTIESFMDGPAASLALELPVRDVYLMKIKARFGTAGQRVEVFVNDIPVGTLVARKVQQAERFSLNVPAEATRAGRNLIVFRKPRSAAAVVFEKVAFSNFQLGDKGTLVLSWNTSPQLSLPWPQWIPMLGSWVTYAASEGAIIWWLSRAMVLPIGLLVLLDLFSYLPLLICMGGLLSVSLISPYRVIVHPSWFLVRGCFFLIVLPKFYLLGVVSRRYVELVRRAASSRTAQWASRHRVNYSDIWDSNQSLVVSLGVIPLLVIFDVRQRWDRLRRRVRWVGRQREGNEPLLWFLGLWGLAAVCLIGFGLTGVGEWIVNAAVIFLGAAVVMKGCAAMRHSHG